MEVWSGEENKRPYLTVKINLAHTAQYVSNDFQITCHLIYWTISDGKKGYFKLTVEEINTELTSTRQCLDNDYK